VRVFLGLVSGGGRGTSHSRTRRRLSKGTGGSFVYDLGEGRDGSKRKKRTGSDQLVGVSLRGCGKEAPIFRSKAPLEGKGIVKKRLTGPDGFASRSGGNTAC